MVQEKERAKTVLIVEDVEQDRLILYNILERQFKIQDVKDYKIYAVDRPDDALEIAKNEKIGLLITDLNFNRAKRSMVFETSIKYVQELVKVCAGHGAGLIVTSDKGLDAKTEELLKKSGVEFVKKPIYTADFVKRVVQSIKEPAFKPNLSESALKHLTKGKHEDSPIKKYRLKMAGMGGESRELAEIDALIAHNMGVFGSGALTKPQSISLIAEITALQKKRDALVAGNGPKPPPHRPKINRR